MEQGPVLSRDFAELAVGDSFATRARTVTEGDVASFASLTGDMHPQHTDAVWAAAGPFGERIAHGMLVISYALGLLSFDPERVMALRRVRDVTFKRPVAIGDTIRAQGRVERLDEIDPATGIVGVRLDIANQHARTVARAGIDVLWRRGPSEATPAAEPFELVGLPL